MDQEILRRIKESKRDYNRKAQKAELMIRNKFFMEELKETPVNFKGYYFEKNGNDLIYHGKNGYKIDMSNFEKFNNFCKKWNISTDWDGKINTLSKFIKETPQIVTSSINLLILNGHLSSGDIEYFDYNEFHERECLYLKIDPWTSQKDIKEIWPRIEKLQKIVFHYKAELRSTFSRDLCWYDLKNKFKLSYGQISKFWIEYCPEDIDLLVMKRIKRKEKKDLSQEDAKELLKEIRNDKSMNDLKTQFEEEREYYISGPDSLFKSAIKEGIKRITKYIKQIKTPQKLLSIRKDNHNIES